MRLSEKQNSANHGEKKEKEIKMPETAGLLKPAADDEMKGSKAYKQDNQHNILDHQNTVGGVPGLDILVQKEQIDTEVPQMEAETDRSCVPKQIDMSRIPVERLSTDQKLNMALDDIVKQTNKSTLKHHNARSGSTSSYHSALKDSCSRSCHTPSKGGTYSKTPESKGSPLSGHRRSPKSFTPSGVMQSEHPNTKRRTILPTSNESAHDILGESSEKTLDDESLIKCSVDKDLHKREVTVTVEKRIMARTFFKIADKIAKIAEKVAFILDSQVSVELTSSHCTSRGR